MWWSDPINERTDEWMEVVVGLTVCVVIAAGERQKSGRGWARECWFCVGWCLI